MATRNNTATRPHNRHADQEEEARRVEEEARRAAEDDDPETLKNRLAPYIKGRQGARLTHEEEEKARSLDEAVVKTTRGLPDMRFAENRGKFMHDPTKKVTGKPDFRFIENRPDILSVHAQRGDDKPNLIFADDGEVEE